MEEQDGRTVSGLAAAEDAATVVLLRDGSTGPEVLLLERPRRAGSFAGAWVFPGGKVDPEDRVSGGTGLDAARAAAVREVFEESGLVLSGDSLRHLSNWVPMHGTGRRFQTWFFIAPAPEPGPSAAGPGIVLNAAEHAACAWLNPVEALERHAAGTMLLVPPTWVTLHHLAEAPSVAAALEAVGPEPEDYLSYILADDGDTRLGADRGRESAPGVGRIIVWFGDRNYPPTTGTDGGTGGAQEGARPAGLHRLDTGSLPWRYERRIG